MKRMITSASTYEERFEEELRKTRDDRKKFDMLTDLLDDYNVTEHTILQHFYDYLSIHETVEVLQDLVSEMDLLEEEE